MDCKESEKFLLQGEIADREGWKNESEHLNLLEDIRRQQKNEIEIGKKW